MDSILVLPLHHHHHHHRNWLLFKSRLSRKSIDQILTKTDKFINGTHTQLVKYADMDVAVAFSIWFACALFASAVIISEFLSHFCCTHTASPNPQANSCRIASNGHHYCFVMENDWRSSTKRNQKKLLRLHHLSCECDRIRFHANEYERSTTKWSVNYSFESGIAHHRDYDFILFLEILEEIS